MSARQGRRFPQPPIARGRGFATANQDPWEGCGLGGSAKARRNWSGVWVQRETKARFASLAHQQGVTESALLKRLEEASLVPMAGVKQPSPASIEPVSASGRLSIRLRSVDLLLLRERAGGRAMPTSTRFAHSGFDIRGVNRSPDPPFQVRDGFLQSPPHGQRLGGLAHRWTHRNTALTVSLFPTFGCASLQDHRLLFVA